MTWYKVAPPMQSSTQQRVANCACARRTKTNKFWRVYTKTNKPKFARFCPFLPIFGQKMGKNRQKTGERKRTLAKQGETESFAEFRFGIATPWS